jgi:hypothetical protein
MGSLGTLVGLVVLLDGVGCERPVGGVASDGHNGE